jgi:alkyl hydroperoxide reductase subunit AhpF
MKRRFDLLILGADIAGLTAALYAARKKIDCAVVSDKIGGQSLLTNKIENFPGFNQIAGFELIKRARSQVERFGVPVKDGFRVVKIKPTTRGVFTVETTGKSWQARSLIIATGKRPRPLNVPGEKKLTGRGVSFCSICDAPLFENKTVAVIGGGNAGMEMALDLAKYARRIYLLEIMPRLRGDEITLAQIRQSRKIKIYTEVQVTAIEGEKTVNGLRFRHLPSGKEEKREVEGVFVAIGQIPNSEFARRLVRRNRHGEIVVNPFTFATSREGIFAAGDVTNLPYKQSIIAAGSGAAAALSAHAYLQKLGR